VLYEIQAILGEVRGLRKELDALDSIFDLFSDNKEKKRTRQAAGEAHRWFVFAT